MKIRNLQLKNIGVFDNSEIEFQTCPEGKAEIHIFTGQNGSGKTTLLSSLISAFDDYAITFPVQSLKNSLGERFRNVKLDPDFQVTNQIIVSFDDETKSTINVINGDGHCELLPKSAEKFPSDKFFLHKLESYRKYVKSSQNITHYVGDGLIFAAFANSGYRHIESKRIEAISEPKDFNPLSQSLELVKNYNQEKELTINQLIANNISKSAIEKGRNEERSKRFASVINTVEKTIFDITNWKIEFDLETEPLKLLIKINGENLEFDVLPDGLRSLISWIADLLGRVDSLKWQDDLPIDEKNLILFLDEIEVHLHPKWQRKVLPVVQKLFKNAQIFVSTHSPFVVNSVDDAWVYKLELENGKAKVAEPTRTENSNSITQVLREVFNIYGLFGKDVQDNIDELEKLRNKILSNGSNEKDDADFLKIARKLYDEPSDQVKNIVKGEIQQINEIKNKKFSI